VISLLQWHADLSRCLLVLHHALGNGFREGLLHHPPGGGPACAPPHPPCPGLPEKTSHGSEGLEKFHTCGNLGKAASGLGTGAGHRGWAPGSANGLPVTRNAACLRAPFPTLLLPTPNPQRKPRHASPSPPKTPKPQGKPRQASPSPPKTPNPQRNPRHAPPSPPKTPNPQ